MQRDLTLVEIIGLAVKSEEEAASFYGHLSKKIGNELVRAKYESLAKEEAGHRHMLLELYKKMTGEKNGPPAVPGKQLLAEGMGKEFEASSVEDLLRFAILREQKANEFYRKASVKTVDVNSKRTLEYLADIESGHEMLLKAELESYLKDKNWYSDNPNIQLVGP